MNFSSTTLKGNIRLPFIYDEKKLTTNVYSKQMTLWVGYTDIKSNGKSSKHKCLYTAVLEQSAIGIDHAMVCMI